MASTMSVKAALRKRMVEIEAIINNYIFDKNLEY
jgi:hypothetical protein